MKKVVLFIVSLSLFCLAKAQNVNPVDENKLAIGGYDVVEYFSNTATKGSEAYTAIYDGASYRFVTEENRKAFRKNPRKYLPQYGGYCAWGVAVQGAKLPINPETFDIMEGKLYLFFNGESNGEVFDTSELWNNETVSLMIAADKKWPLIKGK